MLEEAPQELNTAPGGGVEREDKGLGANPPLTKALKDLNSKLGRGGSSAKSLPSPCPGLSCLPLLMPRPTAISSKPLQTHKSWQDTNAMRAQGLDTGSAPCLAKPLAST